MAWDDLKVLRALARRGSARAAAAELGLSTSTVTRRLDALERFAASYPGIELQLLPAEGSLDPARRPPPDPTCR